MNDSTLSGDATFSQGQAQVPVADLTEVPHVAVVKLRETQTWDDALLDGVAKTLTQLRSLGLPSVIVLDCEQDQISGSEWQELIFQQANRVITAIGRHDSPGAKLVTSGIWKAKEPVQRLSSIDSTDVFVGFGEALLAPLRQGHMPVVPPRACTEDTLQYTPASANDIVFALTSYFSGLQLDKKDLGGEQNNTTTSPLSRKAVVDRIIVIDPHGGIPASKEGDGARVFVNLEEEFEKLRKALMEQEKPAQPGRARTRHTENLKLVKNALSILPATASAVITTPAEAANRRTPSNQGLANVEKIAGEVKTRRWQNPLIHNLLTDRPMYSASLPLSRIKSPNQRSENTAVNMPTTTLLKKGMPVTIFPDTRSGPWTPPKPGEPRLRLTDTCIDLPRLVHLINDSFKRKLDVEDYLKRLENSLAGVIIAGEYEGGAILTWERPFGMDEETAYREGRLVPYLDKFAVLTKSQGAGGVADIVFNAMVRDCFPSGVCWRSRKDNPVNKWYFERSCGVKKLPGCNWAMFWTTPEAATSDQLLRDYEDVCRSIVPSWEDMKKPAD